MPDFPDLKEQALISLFDLVFMDFTISRTICRWCTRGHCQRKQSKCNDSDQYSFHNSRVQWKGLL